VRIFSVAEIFSMTRRVKYAMCPAEMMNRRRLYVGFPGRVTVFAFTMLACADHAEDTVPTRDSGTPEANVASIVDGTNPRSLDEASDGSTDMSAEPEATEVEEPAVLWAVCDEELAADVPLTTISSWEALPGYDEELAALDLEALPTELDLTPLNVIERALVAYLLEFPPDTLGDTLDRSAAMAVEPLGKAVVGAFAYAAKEGDAGLDLPFMRRGFHRYYQCARAFPLTLDGFKEAVFDYSDLAPYELESNVKGTLRRIRESSQQQVYVAETLMDGAVRETEIIVGGTRADGMLDFLVYGSTGQLTDRSAFNTLTGNTVTGSSPYTCMSCHFEPGTLEYKVVFPDM
jgi:hypothetical protein